MTLIEIIEKWMKEDEFLSTHFKIKQTLPTTAAILPVAATINMACFHDSQYHAYDKFVCWVTDVTVESDVDVDVFPVHWIKLHPSDPAFFDDLRKLLFAVHKLYGDYCKPKWQHPKK